MSAVIARPGKRWQGCFDCGEAVITVVEGERSASPAAPRRPLSERERLERRRATLLSAIDHMEQCQAQLRAELAGLYLEPESLVLARRDLAEAEQRLASAS